MKKPSTAPLAGKIDEEDVVDLAVRIISEHMAACGAPGIDLEPLRRRMREHLGGMSHYVRSGRPSREVQAQEAVETLLRDGKTVSQVSRELGIPRTSVWRLRAGVKAP